MSVLYGLCRRRPSTAPNPGHSSAVIEGVEASPVVQTPAAMFVYVKPHRVQLTSDEDTHSTMPPSSTAVDNEWCQQVMAFTDTFKKGYRKRCEAAAAAAASALEAAQPAEPPVETMVESPAQTAEAPLPPIETIEAVDAIVETKTMDVIVETKTMAQPSESIDDAGVHSTPASVEDTDTEASLSSTRATSIHSDEPFQSSRQDTGDGLACMHLRDESSVFSSDCTNDVWG